MCAVRRHTLKQLLKILGFGFFLILYFCFLSLCSIFVYFVFMVFSATGKAVYFLKQELRFSCNNLIQVDEAFKKALIIMAFMIESPELAAWLQMYPA